VSRLSSTEPPADPEPPADGGGATASDEAAVSDQAADDAPGDAGAPGAAPQPAPIDDARLVILDALAAELGDDLVETETLRNDIWVRVRPSAWRRTAEVCRSIGFDYFCFLSGLDWMPSTSVMRGEIASDVADDEEGDQADAAYPATADVEPATAGDAAEGAAEQTAGDETGAWKTGHAGGDTRFQVFARLYSIERRLGLTLKSDLDDDAPAVDTWSDIYPGANWHEREAREMFGFEFVGHPYPVNLYLPGEFEGFPLRKDFPLLAREVKPWPGLVDVEPMPETDEEVPADGAPADGEPTGQEEPASQEAGS